MANTENYDTHEWFKGNTHIHTLWSDGNGFPKMIIDWYKTNEYDFIGMSDHNVLQDGEPPAFLPSPIPSTAPSTAPRKKQIPSNPELAAVKGQVNFSA
ncbi:MAG: histidinol phosphatase-like PHP family hydrolase [Verrucomicrobiales bacterium]